MVTFAYDLRKNAAVSSVATAPSPATSGVTLVVAAGEGARFPTAPFNATVLPVNSIATPSNMEIIRVTARTTDTLTIVRAQEGSSARTIVAGDVIYAGFTDKALADLETILTTYLQPWANKTVPSGAVVGLSDTQALTGKTMDGTVNVFLNIPNSAVPNLGIPKTIVYTASGSLAASDVTGCTRLRVHCWGGGGGTGGAKYATGATCTSGAGGGEYSMSVLDVASVTFPVTVTVGAGGTAGAGTTPTNGGTGGTSSFGSLVTAIGGSGSIGATNSTAGPNTVVDGGTGGTGDFRVAGNCSVFNAAAVPSGGGSSYQGGGSQYVTYTGGDFVGKNGLAPGGGASGASRANTGNSNGGVGGLGRVVVEAM